MLRGLTVNKHAEVHLESHGCRGTPNEVRYLEHVQAVITLTSTRRGDLQVSLTSPGGTQSVLLPRRSRDASMDGFTNWAFMTTHSWGEAAAGVWRLEVLSGASIGACCS